MIPLNEDGAASLALLRNYAPARFSRGAAGQKGNAGERLQAALDDLEATIEELVKDSAELHAH